MPKFVDLTGRVFGSLEVLYRDENKNRQAAWRCECRACGEQIVVRADHLQKTKAEDCRCGVRRLQSDREHQKTHGLSSHPLFAVWHQMIRRCENPDDIGFAYYGARGIRVCDAWRSFENFFADMVDGYAPGLTIDRISNDQGYSKSNCRWATRSEQQRNTRSNRLIEFQGETQPLVVWAEISGLPYDTLHYRIDSGWPVHIALTAPLHSRLAQFAQDEPYPTLSPN